MCHSLATEPYFPDISLSRAPADILFPVNHRGDPSPSAKPAAHTQVLSCRYACAMHLKKKPSFFSHFGVGTFRPSLPSRPLPSKVAMFILMVDLTAFLSPSRKNKCKHWRRCEFLELFCEAAEVCWSLHWCDGSRLWFWSKPLSAHH